MEIKAKTMSVSGMENVLRHFISGDRDDGLTFMAHYEAVGHCLSCTSKRTWELKCVMSEKDQFSFIVSEGNKLMKFVLRRSSYLPKLDAWFSEMSKEITKVKAGNMLVGTIPEGIVFTAGVTEFIPQKPFRQPATA